MPTDPAPDPATNTPDGWDLLQSGDFKGAEALFRAQLAARPDDPAATTGFASSLYRQGDSTAGESAFHQAASLAAAGSSDEVFNLSTWALELHRTKQLDAAEQKADELLKLAPNFPQAQYLSGLIQADKGNLDAAVGFFRNALSLDSTFVDAASRLVDTLFSQHKQEETIAALHVLEGLQKAARLPDRARTLRNLAILLRDAGRLNDAAAEADTLVTDFPAFAPGWNTRARILDAQGDLDGAIDSYRKAVDAGQNLPPRDKAPWMLSLGDGLRKKERFAEAIPVLRDLVAIDPDNAQAWNSLGLALTPSDQDAAVAAFSRGSVVGSRSNPSESKYALRNWAEILVTRGDLKAAEAKFREAIKADPDDPETYLRLGDLLHSDPERAIPAFVQAAQLLEGKPESVPALQSWAYCLIELERYQEAETVYFKALPLSAGPDRAWIHFSLGQMRMNLNKQVEAIDSFRTARLQVSSTDENRQYVLWNLGNALLSQERIDEAVQVYEEATVLPANQARSFFYYAAALRAAGKTDEALKAYGDAIEKDPSDPYPLNNKGDLLFSLGRYPEGWTAWNSARTLFEEVRLPLQNGLAVPAKPEQAEYIDRAYYLAVALRDVFIEHESSLEWFDLVLRSDSNYSAAIFGRAILLRRMARKKSSDTQLQKKASDAMRQACEEANRAISVIAKFDDILVLADLLIEERDKERATMTLDRAAEQCGELRLRRAQVFFSRGVAALTSDESDVAARLFQQALINRADDLNLQTYYGQALLSLKRYQAALGAFQAVNTIAPGHVGALIGSARASIELADAGDKDQYQTASDILTKAIGFGQGDGSLKLSGVDSADVYYLRGYARTKIYEAGGVALQSVMLTLAIFDFGYARQQDPDHAAAKAAFSKARNQLLSRIRTSVFDIIGTLLVTVAAAFVFLLAQLDFFLRTSRLHHFLGMPAASVLDKPTAYATVTFSSLVIMIAGLSLRKLLKLEVAGVKLEKSSDQLPLPAALGLGRFGLFESFANSSLQGLNAQPTNLKRRPAPQASDPDKVNPDKHEKGSDQAKVDPKPVYSNVA